MNSIKLTVIIDSLNDDNDEKFRPTVRSKLFYTLTRSSGQ